MLFNSLEPFEEISFALERINAFSAEKNKYEKYFLFKSVGKKEKNSS